MKINTNIGRIDLLRTFFTILPRRKFGYVVFLVIWISTFYHNYFDPKLSQQFKGEPLFVSILSVGAFCLVVASIVLAGTGLIGSLIGAPLGGALGRRQIEITNDGLKIETPHRIVVEKWSRFSNVLKTKSYIYAIVTWDVLVIIPARDFNDNEQFDTFDKEIRARCSA